GRPWSSSPPNPPSSGTGSSPSARTWPTTTCWTEGTSWWRTPACRRSTTAGTPDGCAPSRCTARPRARSTATAGPCACPGPGTTGGGRPSSTATCPPPAWSGSTTRSAWTPAACSADGSRRCATRSGRSSTCRRSGSGTSRPDRSAPGRAARTPRGVETPPRVCQVARLSVPTPEGRIDTASRSGDRTGTAVQQRTRWAGAGAATVAALALTGCDMDVDFEGNVTEETRTDSYARAEVLELTNQDGATTVVGGDVSEITVERRLRYTGDTPPEETVTEQDGTLAITAGDCGSRIALGIAWCDIDYVVTVLEG